MTQQPHLSNVLAYMGTTSLIDRNYMLNVLKIDPDNSAPQR